MENLMNVKRQGRQNEKIQNRSNWGPRKREERQYWEIKDKFSSINEGYKSSESRNSVSSKQGK